ncbi:MAG: hypothetical protein QOG73_4871, partial [Acetobacteraceae bacterium]|nr:hypothetical protein [Acetobacteraceae bacterium]
FAVNVRRWEQYGLIGWWNTYVTI